MNNNKIICFDIAGIWVGSLEVSGLPLCMEIFTRVVRMFRTWPATYRWRGVVELGEVPVMSGAWERK